MTPTHLADDGAHDAVRVARGEGGERARGHVAQRGVARARQRHARVRAARHARPLRRAHVRRHRLDHLQAGDQLVHGLVLYGVEVCNKKTRFFLK